MNLIECKYCRKEFTREDMRFTYDCHGITYRLVCYPCWDILMEVAMMVSIMMSMTSV